MSEVLYKSKTKPEKQEHSLDKRKYPHKVKLPADSKNSVLHFVSAANWLTDNITDDCLVFNHSSGNMQFCFKNKNDAIMFALKWVK